MINNLQDLIQKFSNEGDCRAYLVQQRWNGSPVCPYCGCQKWYIIEGGKRFKCGSKECYKKYSVTVGTVFEASNIPLTKWFPAMYILTAHKKGISSVQLAKDLGVSQKTAWFMIHRIRESLKEKKSPLLSGTVEIDETYMGRKFRSDFVGLSPEEVEYKFKKKGAGTMGAVMGLKERGTGKIRVIKFDERKDNLANAVRLNVLPLSIIHTDETRAYHELEDEYYRESVKHSAREWVKPSFTGGKVHTNNIENFWSVMKRGIYGIYHQVSVKHLQRYCDEFAYRYNSRTMKDGERFELTLQAVEGRLSYKQLVYGINTKEERNKA